MNPCIAVVGISVLIAGYGGCTSSHEVGQQPDAGPDGGPDGGPTSDPRCTVANCNVMISQCRVEFQADPSIAFCVNASDSGTPADFGDAGLEYCAAACDATANGGATLQCLVDNQALCGGLLDGGQLAIVEECSQLTAQAAADATCLANCNSARSACDNACANPSFTACMSCSAACGLTQAACWKTCPLAQLDGGPTYVTIPIGGFGTRACGPNSCTGSQLCVDRGPGGVPWPCAAAGADGGPICPAGSHPVSDMTCGSFVCQAVLNTCCAADATCVDWSPSSCATSCSVCLPGNCNAGVCTDVCPGECLMGVDAGFVQCGGGA